MKRQDERDREERLQDRAESVTGDTNDPGINAYRVIYRAVREAPMPQPPRDFAAQVAAMVRDHEEQAALEKWISRIIVGAAALAVASSALYALFVAADDFVTRLPRLPWPLLLSAGGAVAAAGAVDAWMSREAPGREGVRQ